MKMLGTILKLLECNTPPYDLTPCTQLHFPKNLSKQKLLSFQLKDNRFCQTFMTEIIILFDSFSKPINAHQKRAFTLSESDV